MIQRIRQFFARTPQQAPAPAPIANFEITKLNVSPDDILVLRTDNHLSDAAHEGIRKTLRSCFGPDVRICVMPGGFSMSVISGVSAYGPTP